MLRKHTKSVLGHNSVFSMFWGIKSKRVSALEVNAIMNEHAAYGRICPKALKMLQKMLE